MIGKRVVAWVGGFVLCQVVCVSNWGNYQLGHRCIFPQAGRFNALASCLEQLRDDIEAIGVRRTDPLIGPS
jgi:hypothetical protein